MDVNLILTLFFVDYLLLCFLKVLMFLNFSIDSLVGDLLIFIILPILSSILNKFSSFYNCLFRFLLSYFLEDKMFILNSCSLDTLILSHPARCVQVVKPFPLMIILFGHPDNFSLEVIF